MESVAVEFKSVTFSYSEPVVLQDAAFSVYCGDFVSVVGPNGGGKTTLLKLILGIIEPDFGVVRLFGDNPKTAAPRVGYTPQQISVDLRFPISALDVALMGRIRRSSLISNLVNGFRYSREDRIAAINSLQKLQLENYANVPFGNLSGGQRQRVLIARAICGEPDLLLLDEPTNNIDASSESILCEILMELNKTMTIIMVSHDVRFVAQCVKNVICVNKTVATHQTSELNEKTLHQLYHQNDVRIVLHDHR
ncbi:MAG: metal ABC transporter ATP-binding protein [Planctomycetaceae bacterium]|jgi:zinc transport system ATP-binding protein|nr:metal ABC transporter ATP-binding protein [Planctomycetaceae bacterium]